MHNTSQSNRLQTRRLSAWARHVIRSEDGNLFIVFFPMILVMVLWGGIAVDLMRFESRRATLQSVTDRAVLAAANLDQNLTPQEVVKEYFLKAGLPSSVADADISVVGQKGDKYRQVSVKGQFDLNTLFMRHVNNMLFVENNEINWKTLTAVSNSTAVQGVGAVEISLVLDLSGSMYIPISGVTPKTRRIEKLRSSAKTFVETLLKDDYKNRISISLVPYSEQVNIGPDLYAALKVNPATAHQFSYCLELPSSSFSATSFNSDLTYEQTQNVQFNAFGYGGPSPTWPSGTGDTRDYFNATVDQPICPRYKYEQIVPITQTAKTLTDNIALMEPRSGTSIFLGLKWGIALLDPSFQSVISKLPTSVIDPVFASRPEPYDVATGGDKKLRSSKYIVLMTDGYNSDSYRMPSQFYEDPSQRLYWANHNVPFASQGFYNSSTGGAPGLNYWTFRNTDPLYTATKGVDYMRSMCTAAKTAGITIYAISMSGDDTTADAVKGRTEMASCASSANHYFATSGAELDDIFARIAKQITDLRLTQ